jgi:hypothetical protein
VKLKSKKGEMKKPTFYYSHPTASQNISDDIFAYRLQQLTQKHSKMAKNVEKIAKKAKIKVKKP